MKKKTFRQPSAAGTQSEGFQMIAKIAQKGIFQTPQTSGKMNYNAYCLGKCKIGKK